MARRRGLSNAPLRCNALHEIGTANRGKLPLLLHDDAVLIRDLALQVLVLGDLSAIRPLFGRKGCPSILRLSLSRSLLLRGGRLPSVDYAVMLDD